MTTPKMDWDLETKNNIPETDSNLLEQIKNTEELNDYLRMYPKKYKCVLNTLSYFNLNNFCKGLSARTLLWGAADVLKNLASKISGKTDIQQSEQSQFKDGLFEEEWIAHNLGFSEPIIPACWRK